MQTYNDYSSFPTSSTTFLSFSLVEQRLSTGRYVASDTRRRRPSQTRDFNDFRKKNRGRTSAYETSPGLCNAISVSEFEAEGAH